MCGEIPRDKKMSASHIIEKRSFQPESYDIEHWPWPIRIYTLGCFSLIVDDQKLEFGSKTQHRPLDLLKALLMHSSGLSCAALMEYLWPDLDGDAARNALGLAVHRLRRLLKHKTAVLAQNGKLMLDRNQIWVDAWALQTLCEHDEGLLDVAELKLRSRKLLHLYRGHFLANEEREWAFVMRDRLRSQFGRSLSALAKGLETLGQWETLKTLLSRGIELDPLNEEFHRRLIRNYRAQGRHAETLLAHRRCCELFAKLLGIKPSAATQALVHDLETRCESESYRKDTQW